MTATLIERIGGRARRRYDIPSVALLSSIILKRRFYGRIANVEVQCRWRSSESAGNDMEMTCELRRKMHNTRFNTTLCYDNNSDVKR